MLVKPKILIFVGYYLPGYKAGGPLRTISNIVSQLRDDFDFMIVTRDRDLGDDEPYANVPSNQWVLVSGAQVYYCSPKEQTISGLTKLVYETPHDALYLNSFFDPIFTVKPLLARFLGKLSKKPILLAPRGEFSVGALKIKGLKKRLYITISKLLGLYHGVIWHASSEFERRDIKQVFPAIDNVLIALDLAAKVNNELLEVKPSGAESKSRFGLNIVFLSRIAEMKNLDFALHILGQISCDVSFDIYGPLEDADYWVKCQKMMDALPVNVNVKYCGSVLPDEVGATFSRYDLFLFPTHGENYGHVIAEALTVGTPVLLSDQTSWKNLKADGLGWDLPLDDAGGFIGVIESCALKSLEEKRRTRSHVQSKVVKRLTSPDVLEANRQLFYRCLKN